MAGEPARALVTDQILFFAPLMFLFLLCVRARHSGTARSHAHGESISLSLDTEKSWSKVRVLPWYFSHTYQSRFQMLLECNAALNWRISLDAKKILRNPDQNDFWRDVTQWVSRVWVYSIYSVIRLKRCRKGSLTPAGGWDCMGIFKVGIYVKTLQPLTWGFPSVPQRDISQSVLSYEKTGWVRVHSL